MTALRVYERALLAAAAGRPARLLLHDHLGGRERLDASRWYRSHVRGDSGLLSRCTGPALDVGCGPGRLTVALQRRGRTALGIDISAAAVRLAQRRGATALRRDVFGRLPGHQRWQHVLLADGNIGIGGDPAALLTRCRELIAPEGRIHVELADPRTTSWSGMAELRDRAGAGALRWAVLAVPDLAGPVAQAALRTQEIWTEAGRWFATLAPA